MIYDYIDSNTIERIGTYYLVVIDEPDFPNLSFPPEMEGKGETRMQRQLSPRHAEKHGAAGLTVENVQPRHF